ncbi:SinI family restriction endonuclease [Aliarcobacter cryaerophilus]|uniref:SinI family restriction endonuclease n=1 Tax=Aliarcobacter cryaerophilus TaxID=28198 RepID=UPI0021B65528|nr:SinI family restriction endonuclease [Aliarcobacter cryaerophilus]MCT7517123.1 SinI family restriction endonuclease [Aliarcobacter cryaerophilus]
MSFSREKAEEIAKTFCLNKDEKSLIKPFVEICSFLNEFKEALSWKGKKPSLDSDEGLKKIAEKYFKGYRKSDFPANPSTVPDEMVSIIMWNDPKLVDTFLFS